MFENEMLKLKKLYEEGCFEKEFYSKKIGSVSMFDSYESFCRIPFTYKNELRETTAFERTSAGNGEVYGIFSSSGTTGNKTYYVYSKEDKLVHEKFVRTFFSELGVTPDDLGGVFAPIDTGVMAQTMMWQFTTMGAGYVNCVVPSPENIVDMVSTLPITAAASRPDILSTLAYKPEWTKAAQESRVNKLLAGGGFLSEERRRLLEKTWNAQVYNMFGMSEMFGPMAGECRCQDGQHYLSEYLMIELINLETKMPAAEGETGIAVYTSLWRKGFPLLRYWTDDVMEIKYGKCSCGSELPKIYFHGRLGDCISLENRKIFPKMLEEILLSNGLVHDYRAVKKEDKITVYIEKDPEIKVSEECISSIRELFTADTNIEYTEPGELHYAGHGKKFFDEN